MESNLKHVAIILDGNGRWAKAKGKPRTFGHSAGAKNVEVICRACHNLGIEYLTLYTFSTENWKRQKTEVEAIMRLLNEYLSNCLKLSSDNNMRVRVIGDRTGLSKDMQKRIAELEERSKAYTGLNLTVAINYGSRDEIVRAVKSLAKRVSSKEMEIDAITEDVISGSLDTAGIPDPDLLIRPGGEKRLSNYLLWQLAYTEFVFSDVLWPDFSEEELKRCVDIYNERNRRFGDAK